MITSNRELQRSTKLQVDAFVTELRAVGADLENMVHQLEDLSTTMHGLKQIMERQLTSQETITAVQQTETAMKIARMKPALYVRLQLTGLKFIFDLRQHQFLLRNSGGEAHEVFVIVGAQGSTYQSRWGPLTIAASGQSLPQNFGPANAFGGVQIFVVGVDCRDLDRREYRGQATCQLGTDWVPIELGLS
jgi:hypothetical protein